MSQQGALGDLKSSALELARAYQVSSAVRTRSGESSNSHWCLNGGSLSVRTSRMDDFLDAVANDYARGVVLCLVEVLTHRFRFFLDLDFVTSSATPFSHDRMLEIGIIIQRCIRTFYPQLLSSSEYTVILCRSSVKSTGKCTAADTGANQIYKHGYHAHMPGIVVDRCRAMYIRAMIVHCMQEQLSARGGSGYACDYLASFESMIDATMFLHPRTSIRLEGADKIKTNDSTAAGRIYAPAIVIGATGVSCADSLASIQGVHGGGLDTDNVQRFRRMLAATSVRTVAPLTPQFKINPNAPLPQKLPPPLIHTNGREDSGTSYSYTPLRSAGAQATLLYLVRTLFDGVYETINLQPARQVSANCVVVKAKSGTTSSRRCHNLKGCKEHTSSCVFFVLIRRNDCCDISQRCFCEKPDRENRVCGSCPSWNANGGKRIADVATTEQIDYIFCDTGDQQE